MDRNPQSRLPLTSQDQMVETELSRRPGLGVRSATPPRSGQPETLYVVGSRGIITSSWASAKFITGIGVIVVSPSSPHFDHTPDLPSTKFMKAKCSIVQLHQCQLKFCERLRAWASFAFDGLVEVCGVNSGLGGEFSQAGFPDGLFGF